MTSILAIANEKGGVAKTTTALSLAGSLAELNYRVLLVDLDPQCNLSISLGYEPRDIRYSLMNVIIGDTPAAQAILPTQVDGLSLLASNRELGYAERVLPSRCNYETLLRSKLYDIKSDFDFIVLDCPPFLGTLVQNALTAADLLLIPTQAEYYSVYALRNMMSLIRLVRQRDNPKLRYRLLITLFDKRNSIHRVLAEHLKKTFVNGVLDTVIEIDTRLRESPISGLPIHLHSENSRATLQYRSLAQEIIPYVKA